MNHESSDVHIPFDSSLLDGTLEHPSFPSRGVILFAHGSGSSRHSARNRFVAERLQSVGFSTLLVDLLTPAEEAEDGPTGRWRFNIPFLATRLTAIADWLAREPVTFELP